LAAPVWLRAAGLALLGAALALALAAFGALGESWRIGVDESEATELVTGGVYAVVRHPLYVAIAWCVVGLLFLDPEVFHGAFAEGAYALLRAQATREERFLAELHGAPYDTCRARTGRFVPRLPLRWPRS
jgi:protein-S-isoprenylcysteine O-methyltransferase Ste14